MIFLYFCKFFVPRSEGPPLTMYRPGDSQDYQSFDLNMVTLYTYSLFYVLADYNNNTVVMSGHKWEQISIVPYPLHPLKLVICLLINFWAIETLSNFNSIFLYYWCTNHSVQKLHCNGSPRGASKWVENHRSNRPSLWNKTKCYLHRKTYEFCCHHASVEIGYVKMAIFA